MQWDSNMVSNWRTKLAARAGWDRGRWWGQPNFQHLQCDRGNHFSLSCSEDLLTCSQGAQPERAEHSILRTEKLKQYLCVSLYDKERSCFSVGAAPIFRWLPPHAAALSEAMCSFSGNFSHSLRCRVSNLKKSVFKKNMFQPFRKVLEEGTGRYDSCDQNRSKWQCYDAYCRVCMGLGQCPSSLRRSWNLGPSWQQFSVQMKSILSPRCESDPPGFELLLYLSRSQL